MTNGLGKEKLWIQTSGRSGEGWASLGYWCPRHTTWVAPWQQNRLRDQWEGGSCSTEYGAFKLEFIGKGLLVEFANHASAHTIEGLVIATIVIERAGMRAFVRMWR